jgi:hypothetical protein
MRVANGACWKFGTAVGMRLYGFSMWYDFDAAA